VILIACVSTQTQAQTDAEIYAAIKESPSSIHWCVPQAGNDPANIIRGRCEVYATCLNQARLAPKIDELPDVSLYPAEIESLRRCHQALYNAARSNPELKGSKATQDWLTQNVRAGTQAKPFAVPDNWKYH